MFFPSRERRSKGVSYSDLSLETRYSIAFVCCIFDSLGTDPQSKGRIGQCNRLEARMEFISCGHVMNRAGFTDSISFMWDTVCLQLIYTIHKETSLKEILKHEHPTQQTAFLQLHVNLAKQYLLEFLRLRWRMEEWFLSSTQCCLAKQSLFGSQLDLRNKIMWILM
jgi:hypothetical protein